MPENTNIAGIYMYAKKFVVMFYI